jgi:hypothetical protein
MSQASPHASRKKNTYDRARLGPRRALAFLAAGPSAG